jgi:hypothetical protein
MEGDRRLVCVLVATGVLLAVGAAFHFGVPVVAPGIQPQFGNAALFRPWDRWTSTYMLVHPVWSNKSAEPESVSRAELADCCRAGPSPDGTSEMAIGGAPNFRRRTFASKD